MHERIDVDVESLIGIFCHYVMQNALVVMWITTNHCYQSTNVSINAKIRNLPKADLFSFAVLLFCPTPAEDDDDDVNDDDDEGDSAT